VLPSSPRDKENFGRPGKTPLIAALIQTLPPSGTDWSTDDRVIAAANDFEGAPKAYGHKASTSPTEAA
jgi:hypothetical protein